MANLRIIKFEKMQKNELVKTLKKFVYFNDYTEEDLNKLTVKQLNVLFSNSKLRCKLNFWVSEPFLKFTFEKISKTLDKDVFYYDKIFNHPILKAKPSDLNDRKLKVLAISNFLILSEIVFVNNNRKISNGELNSLLSEDYEAVDTLEVLVNASRRIDDEIKSLTISDKDKSTLNILMKV